MKGVISGKSRPFKLNSPNGGFKNKRKPYLSGGDWGNRETFINELIGRMI